MSFSLMPILVLMIIAIISALILYLASQKFKIIENPLIDKVEQLLPGANCGGCGYPGCRSFAENCVKDNTLENKFCPVGGNAVMQNISVVLEMGVSTTEPTVAVVRCNGSYCNRPHVNKYDGVTSCAIASNLYGGETGCSFGCIGYGDCVKACKFDALYMNIETGLPEVDDEKCTSCGACVKKCPKYIIELRKKREDAKQIYVNCINRDKAIIARKACKAACIACGKCEKVCEYNAITISNNLAYINDNLCTLCCKCVEECPTKAIRESNVVIKEVLNI